MRLCTKCTNCKFEIKFRAIASDRFKLAKKLGKHINLNCKSCGAPNTFHVNDIKAEESAIVSIVALIIFLGGTTSLFIYIWPYFFKSSYLYIVSGLIGILTVPFLVYQALNSGNANRVQYFNKKKYG